jgi:hypothetical protein
MMQNKLSANTAIIGWTPLTIGIRGPYFLVAQLVVASNMRRRLLALADIEQTAHSPRLFLCRSEQNVGEGRCYCVLSRRSVEMIKGSLFYGFVLAIFTLSAAPEANAMILSQTKMFASGEFASGEDVRTVAYKSRPPGWSHGRKVGWHGRGHPPGQ